MSVLHKLEDASFDTLKEFLYTLDIDNNGVTEYWSDFYVKIRDGRRDKGDCEDATLTWVICCVRDYHIDKDKFTIHRVNTEPDNGKLFNHLIASYGWGTDEEVFFDIIKGGICTYNQIANYRFYSYNDGAIDNVWRLYEYKD